MSKRKGKKDLQNTSPDYKDWCDLCLELSQEIRKLNRRIGELELSKTKTQISFWFSVIIIFGAVIVSVLLGT